MDQVATQDLDFLCNTMTVYLVCGTCCPPQRYALDLIQGAIWAVMMSNLQRHVVGLLREGASQLADQWSPKMGPTVPPDGSDIRSSPVM